MDITVDRLASFTDLLHPTVADPDFLNNILNQVYYPYLFSIYNVILDTESKGPMIDQNRKTLMAILYWSEGGRGEGE